MDYKAVSQQVVDNVGGLENIEGATHCVTRLRLVLKDTSKYNKAELENIDGVKGVLYNSGDRVGNVGVSAPTADRQTQAAPVLESGIAT